MARFETKETFKYDLYLYIDDKRFDCAHLLLKNGGMLRN